MRTDSATTERRPPGPTSRKAVVMRWTTRKISSRMLDRNKSEDGSFLSRVHHEWCPMKLTRQWSQQSAQSEFATWNTDAAPLAPHRQNRQPHRQCP